MATIQKVARKSGHAYRVIIRRKGHKAQSMTFDKRKEADAWAQHVEGNIKDQDAYPDAIARQKTASDLIEKYIAGYDAKDPAKPARLAWWKDQIGEKKLSQLNRHVITEQLEELANESAKVGVRRTDNSKQKNTAKETGKPRSPATVGHYLANFSSVLSEAVRWGWLEQNPAFGIRRPKETSRFGRFLTDDECKALLEACRKSEWSGLYLLGILALSTGGRLAELMGLKWSDIDLKEGLATLHETKNGEPRMLPLMPEVITELKKWGKVQHLDSALVFPSTKDPEKPFEFRKHWNTALTAAEIENFRFHDLRHSCASYLMNAGVSTLAVAAVLGHRNISITQRYPHADVKAKAQLVKDVFAGKL